ncbi:MAG TPA: UDP-N-acetylmuramoyl-tripeptide--D-alanyl-D-alanine ligase [Solirubrobacteraceae bacterium]|nr:UDP-N-acetylmuramoyl-tripeptide--D-alanyl-D-alanine ligase [Solirubrobacteraceae bacterium]
MSIGSIGALLACLAAGWRYHTRSRRSLHLLQLEHYENARLLLWLRRRGEVAPALDVAALLAALVVAPFSAARAHHWIELAGYAVIAAALATLQLRRSPRAELKPLVLTARARRLWALALGAPAALGVAGIVVSAVLASDVPFAVATVLVLACVCGAPWLMCAANRALEPVQRRVNARFEAAAKEKLSRIAPRVVGITGSYGKTTSKVCIGAVLEEAMATLITPASFNSYLGVIRTINEHLTDRHRAFVVEMGMYRAGDIAELCELVHPEIGVLTAIGPVHLERMGTIEAIADAKAELALALPENGHLVTNADDPRCVEIAGRVSVDTLFFGIESPDADVRAERIELAEGETHFELVIGERRVAARAGLLGRHNVRNLLAAAAVGHVCGMSIEEIARGLGRVHPPEHRLQPIRNPGAGIVVIDDAYNSNPAGAEAALEVLRAHPAQRRILVTPGMVELGSEEAELNQRFGRQAAAACDRVILVGPERTRPIAAGLAQEGFDSGAVTVVRDIGAATEVLRGLTRSGDVILFENDLPDMYAEDGG